MRLPRSAHTSQPWRIHEIAPDFRLEDVWAIPATGGPDDFGRLVDVLASYDPAQRSSPVVRLLFGVRHKLGDLFGWDRPDTGVGARVPSLRDRLPADLREVPPPPSAAAFPFTPLYLTGNEWVGEIANSTVHGVLHLGWVPDGTGGCRGQLAVLVKPNGLFGTAYLAAIKPFRHLFVYPTMLRDLEKTWRAAA
jgi:hypothetical protein